MNPNDKDWVTIREAAQITGRHHMTIRNWIKKGLVEWKQMEVGRKRSPIYIFRLSIPTFLRERTGGEGVRTK